jgi:3-oxosteroid 1-dehydrogenase
MSAGTDDWDVVTDVVVVGSGGGSLCAALAVVSSGHQALVIEKADVRAGRRRCRAGSCGYRTMR